MPVSTSLRGRVPGQAVIGAIVAAQQDLPQRSFAARMIGRSPLTAATRGLYRAALGEVTVGESLDQLGPKWDILHVVPVVPVDPKGAAAIAADQANGMQIDHLVIGPPGVFAITTDNYPGQEVRFSGGSVAVGGRPVDDIRDSRRLADSAAERLSAATGRPVSVQAVIAVIGSGKLVVRDPSSGVMVVGAKHLVRLLSTLETALAGPDVAYISNVADCNTTWAATPRPPEEAVQLSHDFAALRVEVRAATRSRIICGVILFAIICAAAWVSTVVVVEVMLGH